jgi:hypothetical protein
MKTIRRIAALLVLASLVGGSGCALIRTVDARIEGRVLLEGLSSGALEGTKVILDGGRVTYTGTDGRFSFSGKITGSDEFEIVIERDGYYSWVIEGSLAYDISAEDVNVTKLKDVTLPLLPTKGPR